MITIFSNDFSNIGQVCGFWFRMFFSQQHYQIIIIAVLYLNFLTGLLGVRFGSVVFYLSLDLLFDLSSQNVFVLYHFLRFTSLCCRNFSEIIHIVGIRQFSRFIFFLERMHIA